MPDQSIIALLLGAGVFIAVIFISRQFTGDKASAEHREKTLSRIYKEQEQFSRQVADENASILRADASTAARILMSVPKGDATYELVLKAGMAESLSTFLMVCFGLFVALIIFLTSFFGLLKGLLLASFLSIFLPRWYLRRRIKKRNEAFINMFPDAVDMIVRSVKSGHPLNSALKMIAENMDPPVKTEFQILVDEIAYGRSTVEALIRLSKRIDEPDLQFFVVILSVQQETGGNLAEVLSNLSGIVRKRKQLRLKIKALTSEGRATGYILGSLPLFVFGAIQLTSPDYLTPLFTTSSGNIVLATSAGLIGLAAFIVYNMLQIDI